MKQSEENTLVLLLLLLSFLGLTTASPVVVYTSQIHKP